MFWADGRSSGFSSASVLMTRYRCASVRKATSQISREFVGEDEREETVYLLFTRLKFGVFIQIFRFRNDYLEPVDGSIKALISLIQACKRRGK